jgi:hypothetical protein
MVGFERVVLGLALVASASPAFAAEVAVPAPVAGIGMEPSCWLAPDIGH